MQSGNDERGITSSILSSMLDVFDLALLKEDHQQIRVVPKGHKRQPCVWIMLDGTKCRNHTNNACNSCNQISSPKYLCGTHIVEHQNIKAAISAQKL